MVSITPEVEFHIRQNFTWTRLPTSVKAVGPAQDRRLHTLWVNVRMNPRTRVDVDAKKKTYSDTVVPGTLSRSMIDEEST